MTLEGKVWSRLRKTIQALRKKKPTGPPVYAMLDCQYCKVKLCCGNCGEPAFVVIQPGDPIYARAAERADANAARETEKLN